jgi:hypothetical protein
MKTARSVQSCNVVQKCSGPYSPNRGTSVRSKSGVAGTGQPPARHSYLLHERFGSTRADGGQEAKVDVVCYRNPARRILEAFARLSQPASNPSWGCQPFDNRAAGG